MRPTWRGSYEASESSCITRAFERYRLLKGGNRIEANIVQVFRVGHFPRGRVLRCKKGFLPFFLLFVVTLRGSKAHDFAIARLFRVNFV